MTGTETSTDAADSGFRPEAVTVIGAGLAGCEAALQLAERGVPTRLVEMKPRRRSAAHTLDGMAELVCSNSLRSEDLGRASGLLKEEMRRGGAVLIRLAEGARVPGGASLAVDRRQFSELVTRIVHSQPLIEVVCEEVTRMPESWSILATGPLTSESLARAIAESVGQEHLFFYDAIAPIVDADSVDRQVVWAQSRYGKGQGDDYLNCPMNRDQYERFVRELLTAEKVELAQGEENAFFEGCLPIETMAARGLEVLSHGPMKPVGLVDPRTGEEPHAVLQLRYENTGGTAFNLVGCQTRMRQGEQKRVFQLIPGLEHARFLRYGSVHRNTFIDAPRLLGPDLAFRNRPTLFAAGQLTGVEGYVESMAAGMLAGMAMAARFEGRDYSPPPAETALGALTRHVCGDLSRPGASYQPTNINWGLFPPLSGRVARRLRGQEYSRRALLVLSTWLARQDDTG